MPNTQPEPKKEKLSPLQKLDHICLRVNEIHQEIMGPPGQPGLKSKVEKQGSQIKGIYAVLAFLGTAFLALLGKIILF